MSSSADTTTINKEQQQNVVDDEFPNCSSPTSSNQAHQEGLLLPDEILNHQVPCETKEGDLVPVRLSLLLQSKLFSNLFKDLGLMSADEKMPDGFTFPVKEISTGIFKRVVEWMEEHEGKDPATRECKRLEPSEYEKQFFAVSRNLIVEQFNAALFLDLNSLVKFGAKFLADFILQKPEEEVREFFAREESSTEEEREEILRSLGINR